MSDQQGKSEIFGRGMPGTGGDLRQQDDDQDVEGHRVPSPAQDGGPDDLYRAGPSTEGEFARRGPGENPHGDR